MVSIDKKRARLEDILDQLEEIKLESDLTEDRQSYVNQLLEEHDSLMDEVSKYEKQQDEIAARLDVRKSKPKAEPEALREDEVIEEQTVPARVKAYTSKVFNSVEDAYVSSMYLASLAGNKRASEFMAAQSIGTDADGGFTVPTPLSGALINLLEDYGVARNACRRIVMGAETWSVPKVGDQATVYYPAEAGPITDSDQSFSQITLTAKKVAALVKMSTEYAEDSLLSAMDEAVKSIAYSMAKAEDDNLFNGVASAINADGIKGDASVDDANVASVAALALTDLTSATVRIGNPIRGARNEWYINPTLFHGKIRDLVNAAGGNTITDLEGGQRPMLLGYPVNFVNIMPGNSASTSGDLLAVFGDMSLAAYFGDRRALSFQILNELFRVNDQVGVVATERIDLKVVNPEVLSKITLS